MGFAYQIEVCLERVEDAVVAEQAGATRIEINSALRLDGLTPSLGSCRWLKENCGLPIIAMVRPHAGSFYLSPVEQRIALRDCESLLDTGVEGIAYGALDEAGELHLEYFQQLAHLCAGKELVCHRAFDALRDQQTGLEQLIDCGVTRVLTSGGAPTAEQGVARLGQLMHWARDRIEILPGGGIHARNAAQIIEVSGCRQVHGTFRGSQGTQTDARPALCPEELAKIRDGLNARQVG